MQLSRTLTMGIVIGMLFLVIVNLVYLKFCPANRFDDTVHHHNFHGRSQSRDVFPGVDKTIIELIPFFHFSALQGSKEGLECAWLERQSTCLLCRCKFDSRDLNSFTPSNNSLRLSQNPSNLTEDPNLELFVQREHDDHVQGSSRFNTGSSFSSIIGRGNYQELLIQEGEGRSEDDSKHLHKVKHKIIVSDVVTKNRWSDVSASDFLSLNSEMLRVISSKRFSSLESSNSARFPTGLSTSRQNEKLEDLERKRITESNFSIIDRDDSSSICFPPASYNESNSSKMSSKETRSVSDITIFPRLSQFSIKNQNSMVSDSGKEEKMRRLWLPIVRKTVQWFSGQERHLHGPENSRQRLNI
ncbi:hypothetical protein DITRI_Ditri10aG0117300 [Diplodiscus trichospermus]